MAPKRFERPKHPMIAGRRVKSLREQHNMSQLDLAFYAGVSQSYISAIELNQRGNVTTDALYGLAYALQVNVDYLMGLTPDPRPHEDKAPLSTDEAELLALYRKLAYVDKLRILHFVRGMAEIDASAVQAGTKLNNEPAK